MPIAIDCMGGDRAPGAIVAGALEALKTEETPELVLVGDEQRIRQELEAAPPHVEVRIVHAPHRIEMHEPPMVVKRRRESSIMHCLELVQKGEAQAVVSAGPTGATLAGTTLLWGLLRGVKRAGIAVEFRTPRGEVVLIDAGAGLRSRPIHLLHHAVMGVLYARLLRGKERPTVGLLNIGAEPGKGIESVRKAGRLLEESELDYVGFVEGDDLFAARTDVVVCDGFVGNILIKVSEGFATCTQQFLAEFLGGVEIPDEGLEALRKFSAWTDYSHYGGAPLLGVRGTAVVCHGKSGPAAICSAIQLAVRLSNSQVAGRIEDGISDLRARGALLDRWMDRFGPSSSEMLATSPAEGGGFYADQVEGAGGV